jgi:hypothetical protein
MQFSRHQANIIAIHAQMTQGVLPINRGELKYQHPSYLLSFLVREIFISPSTGML